MKIHDYAYYDGKIVKASDAKISVMTHAFMYGTSVFEGIRAYWNPEKEKLYMLKAREHYERLLKSCKILRIETNLSVDQMIEKTVELLKKNKPKSNTYIRPVWYKCAERIGPTLLACSDDKEDDFLINTVDMGDYIDTSKGLSVCVSNWRRLSDNAIPARAKVGGSYVNTSMAKSSATLAGFDEAIFLTESGKVAEGSAMNLFIVRDGHLVTPAVTENILEGITRKFIIEIAEKEFGIKTMNRVVDRTELYVSDEAFFVGTGAQVSAITKIDHYDVGDGAIGSITKKLQDKYFDICHGKDDKYKDALIEIDYSSVTA